MNEEVLATNNTFSTVLVNDALLAKHHIFLKASVLSLGYPDFQKSKRFCNKLIFGTSVKLKVYPLKIPNLFHFRGSRVLTHVLKKCKEKNQTKYAEK